MQHIFLCQVVVWGQCIYWTVFCFKMYFAMHYFLHYNTLHYNTLHHNIFCLSRYYGGEALADVSS